MSDKDFFKPMKDKAKFRYDKYNDKIGRIYCGHDFWEKSKSIEYGQIIQCNVCKQWFVKSKECVYVSAWDAKDHICNIGGDYFHRISLGYRE
jgi:hypothetical protein